MCRRRRRRRRTAAAGGTPAVATAAVPAAAVAAAAGRRRRRRRNAGRTRHVGDGSVISCPHISADAHKFATGSSENCPKYPSLELARAACDLVPSCDALHYKDDDQTCFKKCNGSPTYFHGYPGQFIASVRTECVPPSPPPPYRPPPSAPPPAPPFDVNDERTDDEEGAKECFEEAMGDGLTCDHYEALGEGGTLQIAQSKEGTTCYYPNDDSVYFDCEETSMQRVCYCE